jgi:hypothetical protein
VRAALHTVVFKAFFIWPANGAQTRITDFNHKLWSQLNLTEPEEIPVAVLRYRIQSCALT